ncbi:hypothetical protein LJR015_003878 [Peribacillus frigoritolerans]|uniref:hypothetical protein n=1 Tax=Peribacillus TaxID=2675229 RepID=UPI001595C01E|nr:hypothetical protein [Peribacillus simplex]
MKGFVRTLFDSRFPGKESGNEAGVSQWKDVKPVAMDMDKGIGFLNEILDKIAY